MTRKIVERRKQAQSILDELFKHPKEVWIIHYSCESFYDRPEGTSPRITSIAVKNLDSGQVRSFSIHQEAELQEQLGSIEENYNTLEKSMLDKFFEFLTHNQTDKWVHWNMRDVNYGFQAIEHRYKVLGRQDPIIIPDNNKMDLSGLLISIYGVKYIPHPRLKNLLEKNKIYPLNFLDGEQEAKAFENKDYVALHRSTLKKVDLLANILRRTHEGHLRTNTTWFELHCSSLIALTEWLKEHPIVFILGLVATVLTIFAYFHFGT